MMVARAQFVFSSPFEVCLQLVCFVHDIWAWFPAIVDRPSRAIYSVRGDLTGQRRYLCQDVDTARCKAEKAVDGVIVVIVTVVIGQRQFLGRGAIVRTLPVV